MSKTNKTFPAVVNIVAALAILSLIIYVAMIGQKNAAMIVGGNDELYEMLSDFSSYPVIITDDMGKVTHANEEAEKVFGQLVGRNTVDLMPQKEANYHRDHVFGKDMESGFHQIKEKEAEIMVRGTLRGCNVKGWRTPAGGNVIRIRIFDTKKEAG